MSTTPVRNDTASTGSPSFSVVLFDLDDTLFAHVEAVARAVKAHRAALGGAIAAADETAELARWRALEEEHYHRYLGGELDFLGQRRARARDFVAPYGIELDDEAASRAVQRLKEQEHRGYHYEAAPASFELLLRREAGTYKSLFRLESFRVVVEKHADGEVTTEATVKVEVDGKRYFQAAEGNGPVNALDKALRGAIADRYPHLADVELTNYKVRILDEAHGTGAVTRVLLDSADDEREWGTTGVSENIIEASWEALVDSLEYAFQ
jgi:2-isopropylmalate synthase